MSNVFAQTNLRLRRPHDIGPNILLSRAEAFAARVDTIDYLTYLVIGVVSLPAIRVPGARLCVVAASLSAATLDSNVICLWI